MFHLQKYKICLLATVVVLGASVPIQCNAEDYVTGQIKPTDERLWHIVQGNIREFLNMPHQKLLTVLGTPHNKTSLGDDPTYAYYSLGNGVEVCLDLTRGRVSGFSFVPSAPSIKENCLPYPPAGLPAANTYTVAGPFPDKGKKATYEKRWHIVKANIRKFINMPRQELLKVLGPPSCSVSTEEEEEDLVYYLSKSLELRFTLDNDRVLMFSCSEQPKMVDHK